MPAPPQSINALRVLLTLLYLNLNLPRPQPVPPCQQLLASPHSLSSTHLFFDTILLLAPQLPMGAVGSEASNRSCSNKGDSACDSAWLHEEMGVSPERGERMGLSSVPSLI